MSDISYKEITLYPNVSYRYLATSATKLLDCELKEINSLATDPTWNDIPGAVFLADYSANIDSKSAVSALYGLKGWRVYRGKEGSSLREFVAELGADSCGVEDYMCANQRGYTYYVVPVIGNKLGQPIKSNKIKTNWWNYSLTGFKADARGYYVPYIIWLFDCNLTSTQITQNLDTTTFRTFTQRPKLSKGKSNYQTMGINALLGSVSYVSNKYEEDMDLLEKWQEFVGECDLCIWKDRKGAIKIGTIYDNPSAQYIDEISDQPTQISFTFVETKDISDFSVLKEVAPSLVWNTPNPVLQPLEQPEFNPTPDYSPTP